jgi:hypothetical protein
MREMAKRLFYLNHFQSLRWNGWRIILWLIRGRCAIYPCLSVRTGDRLIATHPSPGEGRVCALIESIKSGV